MVLVAAVGYGVVAALLAAYIDRTLPATATRLLSTVVLVVSVPLVATLAWVLSGGSVRRRATLAMGGVLGFVALSWLVNGSSRGSEAGEPYLIAHRGVHQHMHAEHDDPFACVSRIHPPAHAYIENTIPSIQAAFDAGARVVEIDIRETADGDFAVFHDDLLDCKTEARGRVADRTMDDLRVLDVGYGYVTEAGDHPLRGRGVGMMRSLHEILDAFPGRQFIVDVKFGDDAELWPRLVTYLGQRARDDQRRVAVYGVAGAVERLRHALPDVVTGSREAALRCARSYILLGWSGYVPAACHRRLTGTYDDTGWVFWGWPATYVERMERAGSLVIMRRRGQTEPAFAASIPAGYTGGIQTDHVESFRAWMRDAP